MTVLCRLADLADPGSLAAVAETGGTRQAVMVVRRGDLVRAYVNSCPHIGAPLDFTPGRFLDVTGERILCATHGALFHLDDGTCLSGPCVGKALDPVAVEVVDGLVRLS